MATVKVEKDFEALGTDIYIQIISSLKRAEEARKDIGQAEKIFKEKEIILSRFNPDSEISYLNSHLGKRHQVSPDIIHLAGQSLYYNGLSAGLFDPRIINTLENIGYKESFKKIDFNIVNLRKAERIGTDLAQDLIIDGNEAIFHKRMDFAGIAKGYICDLATDFLKSRGWENFLVDAGGDMFAAGKNQENKDWIIDIENPKRDKMYIHLSDMAIATSGADRRQWAAEGKRFHHLINMKDPENFDFNIQSVTVTGRTVEICDMWAKTLFLMGEKAKEYAIKHDMKAVLIYEDGRNWMSS